MSAPNVSQVWNAEGYVRNAGFVSDLGAGVLDVLAAKPGERILDLGCGEGALTARLAATGARVTGVDGSDAFVVAARARGLDAACFDAHAIPYQHEFDAVFSNAALHWMLDPQNVLARVHRALRPGGRFVAEMGGHGNVAAIRVAISAVLSRRGIDARARSPWYFPTAAEYRARLEAAGFTVDAIELFGRPTALPTGIEGWLDTFAAPLFAALAEHERTAARDEAIALLRPVLRDVAGSWTADYVRLRFAARREG